MKEVFIAVESCKTLNMVVCFFRQKTAYDVFRGFVGSERCVSDRTTGYLCVALAVLELTL